MIELDSIASALAEYVERVVPAMVRRRYHLTLVKGGPEYPHLPEQSHFAHIVNGIFALAQLLKFMVARKVNVPGLDENLVRRAFTLYTIHEVHKDRDVELLGSSEFSIPLQALQTEYKELGLDHFAAVDANLMRAANVHKRSPKHGDLLLSHDANATRLWLLVRIADTLASVKDPQEGASSLAGYLADLAPAFVPTSPPGRYRLHYHEIKDIRGVLTNTIHQAVAGELEESLDFFPLLYFSTGTLYVGPADLGEFDRAPLINKVSRRTLGALVSYGSENTADAIKDAQRAQQCDFETFVYSFASASVLLTALHDMALAPAKPATKVIQQDIDALLSRDLLEDWTADTVQERLGISLHEPKEFNEHWARARMYLLYADKMLDHLAPKLDRVEWLTQSLGVPDDVAGRLREVADAWAVGGLGKYILPMAYHFLRGPEFEGRRAESLPPETVLARLHQRMLEAMGDLDTDAGRQSAVAELGLGEDLRVYLDEHLHLSPAPIQVLSEGRLQAYSRAKGKGHTGRVCSICNRISPYTDNLRTGILDDFGRVFSNRVLPAREAPSKNRLWCPVCQIEFILRKLTGAGLASRAAHGKSRRIHLYVLPTFSFTPEHLRLFEPMLKVFQRVTNLPIRDYGQDWGVPHYWLEQRDLGADWFDDLQGVLEREADKIADWGGRSFVGERVSLGQGIGQPHFFLITWEKTATDRDTDDARIATRTEAWSKALFAAAVISSLTSCKVYVTERAYLPVADAAELRATITLDSPPAALRGMLGERGDAVSLYGREQGSKSGLERVLDLGAALWTVTADVHAAKKATKDKYIAGRLGLVNRSSLAGATFYKEFARLNEGMTPYLALATACRVLLEEQAGEGGDGLMDIVQRIGDMCLRIALPRGASGRGKPRRYELVFREAVAGMRKAEQVVPDMRLAALGSGSPPDEAVEELKRLAAGTLLKGLERRRGSRRGEIVVRAWGNELSVLVGELIDTLVDELYLGRAGGNFGRFLRLENAIADGIYYYTDRNLSQAWDEYRKQRAAARAADLAGKEA